MIEHAPASPIAEYSATEHALATLRERYAGQLYDVTKPAEMKAAREARAELRTLRTDLEKKRVALKAPALERSRLIDAEAKRITQALAELEEPIDVQIRAEEDRKAREKAEREQVERERVKAINDKIVQIRAMPLQATGKTAAEIAALYGTLDAIEIAPEQFQELADEARDARTVALAALADLHSAKKSDEDERARIKAEGERLAEVKRQQDAEAAAERERIAAEERAARQVREKADADAKAIRDAADAEAAKERAKADAEAAAARAAEQQRIDAQRAELEREAEAKRQKEVADRAEAERAIIAKRAAEARALQTTLNEFADSSPAMAEFMHMANAYRCAPSEDQIAMLQTFRALCELHAAALALTEQRAAA